MSKPHRYSIPDDTGPHHIISFQQFCRLLNLSERQVRNLLSEGKLAIKPVRLTERKLGFVYGEALELIERSKQAA